MGRTIPSSWAPEARWACKSPVCCSHMQWSSRSGSQIIQAPGFASASAFDEPDGRSALSLRMHTVRPLQGMEPASTLSVPADLCARSSLHPIVLAHRHVENPDPEIIPRPCAGTLANIRRSPVSGRANRVWRCHAMPLGFTRPQVRKRLTPSLRHVHSFYLPHPE